MNCAQLKEHLDVVVKSALITQTRQHKTLDKETFEVIRKEVSKVIYNEFMDLPFQYQQVIKNISYNFSKQEIVIDWNWDTGSMMMQ